MEEGVAPDLYVTNFIYDHVLDGTQHIRKYTKKFPVEKLCDWEKVKPFHYSHMLLMHALLYKRENLINSNTVLPEHTFYVDNIYAYKPLPYMKSVFYLNVDLYHYFIGRSDQSVNRANIVKRYEQQIRVMKIMLDSYKWDEIKRFSNGLKRYMWHSLQAIMMTTIFFICAEDSPERRKALKELWRHLKVNDKKLYNKLRYRSYCVSVNFLSWKMRGRTMNKGYNFLCKKVKLG